MGRRKNKVRKYLEDIKLKYNTHLYYSLNDSSKKELLNKLYHAENLSMSDVSECIGKSHRNNSWFRQFSIEKKSRELELKEPSRNIRTPRNMLVPLSEISTEKTRVGNRTYYRNKNGLWFTIRRITETSRAAREFVYYVREKCVVCNKETFQYATDNKKKRHCYCSKRCKVQGNTGYGNHSWKGGKWYDSKGYIKVVTPHDHPLRGIRSSIPEHRLIVENDLGRHLSSSEHVHHIDLDKSNNHIENLLVTTNSEHKKIHNSLDECCMTLIKRGLIRFNSTSRKYEVVSG